MSKKAKKFSSSAILWQGISPFTIFVNMVDMGFRGLRDLRGLGV
jgi:hypothetical protein